MQKEWQSCKKYIDHLNGYFTHWAGDHTPPAKTSKGDAQMNVRMLYGILVFYVIAIVSHQNPRSKPRVPKILFFSQKRAHKRRPACPNEESVSQRQAIYFDRSGTNHNQCQSLH
jgi:hypothetical protein